MGGGRSLIVVLNLISKSFRQFDVSSGNQLVECQECHNLYHQVTVYHTIKSTLSSGNSISHNKVYFIIR